VALLALPVLTFIGVALVHWMHATAQTATILEAVFVAAGTILAAALAVPRHMTVIGGAVIALATLASHYWWHLSPQEWAPVLILIQTLFGMSVRHQATPVFPPVPGNPA
jgi:hypothetical protein